MNRTSETCYKLDSASGRHQRVGVSLLSLTSFGLRGRRA